MKHYSIFILFIIITQNLFSQNYSEQQIKTAFVYQFCNNIEWTDQDFEEFTIAFLGKDSLYIENLKILAETKKIKNTPIKVISSTNYNSLLLAQPQVLIVEKDYNENLKSIYYDILLKQILLITDQAGKQIYIMLNFVKKEGKITFELNRKNIEDQNLKILPKLLLLGGTELDVKELYKQKEKELAEERQIVQEQQEQLKVLQEKIAEQMIDIQKQSEIIEQKKKSVDSLLTQIKTQKKVLETQKQMLAQLQNSVKAQQKKLQEKTMLLMKQQDSIKVQKNRIAEQQKQINEKLTKLDELNSEINEREAAIEEQKKTMLKLQSVVSLQRKSMFLLIIFILLLGFIVYYVFKNYRQKKELNQKLVQKNKEVEAQAEELRLINEELEKLSIVASHTDNVVIICDNKGKILWVNDSFYVVYGEMKDFDVNVVGKYLAEASASEDVKLAVEKLIKTKKSVIYDKNYTDKNGNSFWLQTNLTPILKADNNLKNIVAVETDITKIKQAEAEISQKNSELIAQRDTIKEQNEQITDSIIYAQNIQNAMLPDLSQLDNIFQHFLIYRPRNIVSGDFYWYYKMPQEESNETYFIVVADSTGHGVPGAFMSLIGIRLLTETIAEKKIFSPKDILEVMDNNLTLAMKSRTKTFDGIDLALLKVEILESKTYQVTFAGAKLPIIIYKHQDKSVTRYRGSIRNIRSYSTSDEVFENDTFLLSAGDIIYMYTDGYIDQNNVNRKRIGTPKFLEIIRENSEKTMEEQKQFFEKFLDNWQTNTTQRDDITVLGLKFK